MKKTLFPMLCPECMKRRRLVYSEPKEKGYILSLVCPKCGHTCSIKELSLQSCIRLSGSWDSVSGIKKVLKREWEYQANRIVNGRKLDSFLKSLKCEDEVK